MFTVILVSLALSLIACNSNKETKNTITEANLTDREIGILSATADKSFIFDFNVDSKYKEVSIWIEKYEAGELINDKLVHITSDITEHGQVIFATLDSQGRHEQSMFNVSILDENGSARVSHVEEILDKSSSTWGSNPEENIPIMDEIVLASIAYSNESHMSSLSAVFYSDMDSQMEEIKDYDVVYLLKADFIK